MKSGWVTKKLGEVCELINGKNQSEVSDPNGKYPIYGSGGVMGHATDYRCPAGCTIIGRKGSINNPIFVNEKFWNVDTAYALSPKGVNEKWLFYFCRSFDFSALDCGTTIPSLTSTLVKNIDIPIPPLAEQKRIVAKIDAAFEKIDALKANAEKNLANAKELFQSALDEAMRPKKGWVEKRLGEVCDVLAGYPFRGNAFSETGIKICGGLIITPTEIKWNECKYWDSSKGLEDYLLAADDIVMALDRPWIADGFKIGMIEENDLPCLLIQRTARLRAKKVTPKYLLYLLRHPAFKKYCTFTGATVPHISHKDIERYMIPCPSLPEQKQIVKRLDFLSEKIKLLDHNYSRQIADCAEMRQAILREAFEGRL